MASEFDIEDMGALEDMGAPTRSMRMTALSRRGGIRRRPPIVNAIAGVPPVAQGRTYQGLGLFQFTNASAQVAALTGLPQVPFRPRRLELNVLRTAGAAAIGVNVTSIFVGQVNVSAGQQATFAEAFGPTAQDTVMQWPPAQAGITIAVNIATTATPGAGETVTVQGNLIGDTVM